MNLRLAVSLAAKLAARNSTLPILGHLRFAGRHITSTDLAHQLEIPVDLPARVIGKGFCVHGARLAKLLDSLPEEEPLDIERTDAELLLRAGRTEYRLKTLPPDDFPNLVRDDTPATVHFTVHSDSLTYALNFVRPAAPSDDIRYYLNGVHLRINGSVLTVTATNGHRLHRARVQIERPEDEPGPAEAQGIVALAAVPRLLELAEQHKTLEISLSPTRLVVHDQQVLESKLIEGTYPEADRVIPADRPVSGTVKRKAMTEALQRVGAIWTASTDKLRAVNLQLTAEHSGGWHTALLLSTRNTEGENATTGVEWTAAPPERDYSAHFQHAYLSDAFSALSLELVHLHLAGPEDSLYLTSPEGWQQVVIMPARM